jgi:cysteine desulfurase
MPPIYLDNHATTPPDPRVLDAMLPVLREDFGNASSRYHPYGLRAHDQVDQAREQVAALINAQPSEVIFTSGATESNNLAIQGAAHALNGRGRHLITTTTEHHAVIDPMKKLADEGWDVTFLPVDGEGRIDLDRLKNTIRDDTVLVSLMAANNEIGVLHPVAEIGALCRERGVTFHCDAVQAAGKIPIDVEAWQVDLISLSAHKFHGPKGIGALYLRRRKPRARLEPITVGGGQELGLRSGTYNTPAIVGMGTAAEIARNEQPDHAAKMRTLRDRLWTAIQQSVPAIALNGPQNFDERLPNNLNIEFKCCEAQSILMGLSEEVACSPGSACTSDNTEGSYVLLALGADRDRAVSSLRFGVSHLNTEDEIDRVAPLLAAQVKKLRAMSPLWQTEFAGNAS